MWESVAQWMQALKLAVKSEFILPWGSCDLVGLSFNKRNVTHRLKLGQNRPISSVIRAALLLRIPDVGTCKSITIRHLNDEYSPAVSPEEVREHTHRLIEDGFVIQRPGDRLQKLNGWMPLQKRLIAVELKLNRVIEALSQAKNNFGFATESYVALPQDVALRVIKNVSKRNDFTESGVGLLAVTRSSCDVVIRSSKKTSADNFLQLYCVEKFWRTRSKGN